MVGMAIRSNFRRLLGNKIAKENRLIRYKDINEATGIPVKTISAWDNNKVTQFHAEILETFCLYFGCQVGDLLELVNGHETEAPND